MYAGGSDYISTGQRVASGVVIRLSARCALGSADEHVYPGINARVVFGFGRAR